MADALSSRIAAEDRENAKFEYESGAKTSLAKWYEKNYAKKSGDVLGSSTIRDSTSNKKSSSAGSSGNKSTTSNSKSEAERLKAQQKKDIEAQKKREAENKKRLEAEKRGRIESQWAPILSEIDRQLATLPGAQQEYEKKISDLTAQQEAEVERSKQAGLETLAGEEAKQETLSKGAIRDLEGDIRNQLQAAGYYFGARGAGDSSATQVASEAVARQGQRSKAGIMETKMTNIADIGQRKAEVENTALTEKAKIKQYASEKLYNINDYFKNKFNDLFMQKANAGADKAKAIDQFIDGLEQQYMQAVAGLDAEVRNFNQSIDTWQMQREAEMEDFAQQIAIQKSYQGADASTYGEWVNRANEYMASGLSAQDAADTAARELQYDYRTTLGDTNTEDVVGRSTGPSWSPWAMTGAMPTGTNYSTPGYSAPNSSSLPGNTGVFGTGDWASNLQ